MIQFPETAMAEWEAVAAAARAKVDLADRLRHELQVERKTEDLRILHESKVALQQELDADLTPALEMTTLANYKNSPATAPQDLIDGALKDNSLCIVLGPSGSGKTSVALQMLHSVATGTDWLGCEVQHLTGGLGVLSYDMDGALMADWLLGFPHMDPDKIGLVNAFKRGNPLGVPAMRQRIAQEWKQMGVEVVVLDSFGASFFGENQNDAAATMHHYRDLRQFALTECGARVLIVIVHATEGNPLKPRGSSVHHDVADSILAVVKDDTGTRTVSVVKYRTHRGGPKQMTPVVIGPKDPVTGLVDLDTGAMTLAGHPLPPGYGANAFLPQAHTPADTTPDPDEQDDDDSETEADDL